MTAYLFFGTVAATFACLSWFIARFIAGGVKYAEKNSDNYEKLTMGNPLNALLISRVLTHEGLVLRGTMIKSIVALWAIFLITAIVITEVWPGA
ncbi:hypothetical protein [Pinirhizobacter soli]|uniref:hypothetical protein n=1 Tax=Pinirhizobacter soli TaxID=2786953 RepID=UPI00202AA9A4|nr:hypothetical protein [Pinirhizobacter soli]